MTDLVLEVTDEPISLELIVPAPLQLEVVATQPSIEITAVPTTVEIAVQGTQGPIGPSGAASMTVSTDGSFGRPLPTGVGLEFIITANALEDIQMNGVSL